ncbi:hypothetical protein BYT27DRAFT_7228055 [Phlegmacium glaucopus]|nr:hypothetical protein BYT27DRAFT_7228055 [Phlegmacium glaucopus]
MVFPFTFKFSIPGLNPFASQTSNQTPIVSANVISHDSDMKRCRAALQKTPRPRPPSSPSPSPAPLSRKRGWEPSFAEPSQSTTTLASTSGYLDTPAKYRQQLEASDIPDEYHNISMSDSPDQGYSQDEEMPPLKRRRGLAGSIISTAVSAALIGSAVGLTVYRLWRDRGREASSEPDTQQRTPPPPPYQQGEWKPAAQVPPPTIVTPPTPVQTTPRSIRKSRHLQITSTPKRPVTYHRKSRSRAQASGFPIPAAVTPYLPVPQPEFNFGYHQEEQVEQTPIEDKMDWIGDKLSMLIEQGKRALNAEVVVMSDAKEDEVDDGSGGWEEEDNDQSRTPSRASSLKRSKRPRSILPPSFTAPLPHASSASPRRSMYDSAPTTSTSTCFASSSAPGSFNYTTPHKTHSRGISYETGLGLGLNSGPGNGALKTSPSFMEDSSSWESPEIRESMERARLRYLEKRSRG